MGRARDAMVRLGAPLCPICRRRAEKWIVRTRDPSERPVCEDCFYRREKEEAERLERLHESRLARIDAVYDADRTSSQSYRQACAAMHDDVTDMLGSGWDPW
jgi:transposase-like protein